MKKYLFISAIFFATSSCTKDFDTTNANQAHTSQNINLQAKKSLKNLTSAYQSTGLESSIKDVEIKLNAIYSHPSLEAKNLLVQEFETVVQCEPNGAFSIGQKANCLNDVNSKVLQMGIPLEHILAIDMVEESAARLSENLVQIKGYIYYVQSVGISEYNCSFRASMDWLSAAKALENRFNYCKIKSLDVTEKYTEVKTVTLGYYSWFYYERRLYSNDNNDGQTILDAQKWNEYYDGLKYLEEYALPSPDCNSNRVIVKSNQLTGLGSDLYIHTVRFIYGKTTSNPALGL